MAVISTVLVRGEPQFNMVGQRLPDSLHDTDQQISAGLVRRLMRFASDILNDHGFEVSAWNCEVSTMDGDKEPPERYYVVSFTNRKGGQLGVQGIMTKQGWPTIHHGLFVDFDAQAPALGREAS